MFAGHAFRGALKCFRAYFLPAVNKVVSTPRIFRVFVLPAFYAFPPRAPYRPRISRTLLPAPRSHSAASEQTRLHRESADHYGPPPREPIAGPPAGRAFIPLLGPFCLRPRAEQKASPLKRTLATARRFAIGDEQKAKKKERKGSEQTLTSSLLRAET